MAEALQRKDLALDQADVDRWLADFLRRLRQTFRERLVFVALHGSWARGEPRPGSDIDLAVVVDRLDSQDLTAFHSIVAEMPDARALASGIFLSVPELKALRHFERISLFYGCRVLHGTLEGIIDRPGPADLREHIQVITSANLFHARHYLLYPHDWSRVVHKLYYPFKESCYALQSWVLLREGRFMLTKNDLAEYLPGADDKEVIRIARHWHELEQDREERPLYYIELLERWSRNMLLKLQAIPARPAGRQEGGKAMLTGIHFLLSYKCDSECDHCFVYSGPRATGTFTLSQVQEALNEAARIGTVEMVYFEGGEPFLFYPLMLEGIRIARGLGFKTGVVTNAYWATSEEDAALWLRPLLDLEVSDISISDDDFHYQGKELSPARRALNAAKKLGLPYGSISIDQPRAEAGIDKDQAKGAPVIAGGVMFRGRAVEKLLAGLLLRPWQDFRECPYEDLASPKRVHLDSYGNVHLCQGLSLGNMWDVSLSKLVKDYRADSHPVCRPLLQGGPAQLVAEYDVRHDDQYVDACHLCYLARRALLDRFPRYLAPRQVYGLD